jgi:prepilin-type N-terminal cleavage/methylation domain-containing protein
MKNRSHFADRFTTSGFTLVECVLTLTLMTVLAIPLVMGNTQAVHMFRQMQYTTTRNLLIDSTAHQLYGK